MKHNRDNANHMVRDMRLGGLIKDAAQTVLLSLDDPVLNCLFVTGVSGGGGKGYTVHVEPRDEALGIPAAVLVEKLRRVTGRVRDEVSNDISRKRVPTIAWLIAPLPRKTAEPAG